MYDAHDLTWREYQLPDGNVVLAKRCKCRASFADTVVISVFRSESLVAMYPHQGSPVCSVLMQRPRKTFTEYEIAPHVIYQYIGREDTERVIGEATGAPFTDMYPANKYIEEILEVWRRVRFPGWIYSTMGSRGFSFLKDIDGFGDGELHTAEVTDRGIAIYHSNIRDGCTLLSDDRLLYMDNDVISAQMIEELCCWSHANEICGMQRALRRWLFRAVVARNS